MHITYTREQQAAIDSTIVELDRDGNTPEKNGWLVVERNGSLCQRGNEFFAIFGTTAFKLLAGPIHDADTDTDVEFLPVVHNGHCIAQFPEEGASGVLHLMRIPKRRGKIRENAEWWATFISCAWLNTDELNASNEEILEHIAEEIVRGETPLTGGGLPGWA